MNSIATAPTLHNEAELATLSKLRAGSTRPTATLDLTRDSAIQRVSEGTRNRIRAYRERHQLQRQRGIFCFVQCLPFAVAWMLVFVDLCLMLCLTFNSRYGMTLISHPDWKYTSPLLTLQAAYALLTLCAAGGIIASRASIKPFYFGWVCASLCILAVTNLGWTLHEMTHGHRMEAQFWKADDETSLIDELRNSMNSYDRRMCPPWMDEIQNNMKCCGVVGFHDWKSKFGFTSLPDSCCRDMANNCGEHFFLKRSKDRPSVHEKGCSKSEAWLTYRVFNLLLLTKTGETFFFVLNTLIWLFCLRRDYPNIALRQRRLDQLRQERSQRLHKRRFTRPRQGKENSIKAPSVAGSHASEVDTIDKRQFPDFKNNQFHAEAQWRTKHDINSNILHIVPESVL